MDTVFRVVGTSTEGTQETYLLEDWAAAANKTLVDQWVTDLSTLRVQNDEGDPTSREAICQFDEDNLWWSGQALLNSISETFWAEIEKEVGDDPAGPSVLCVIMSKMQHMYCSAIRGLTEQLGILKLTKELAENVEMSGSKVLNIT